jgi:hypothetical protein
MTVVAATTHSQSIQFTPTQTTVFLYLNIFVANITIVVLFTCCITVMEEAFISAADSITYRHTYRHTFTDRQTDTRTSDAR